MTRHKLRKFLVFSIYKSILLETSLNEINTNFKLIDYLAIESNIEDDIEIYKLEQQISNEDLNYISKVFDEYKLNYKKDLELISQTISSNWKIERLDPLDKAIIHVAYIEAKHKLIDKKIAIDEAINIAKTYCTENNHKYINGVLDSLCKAF